VSERLDTTAPTITNVSSDKTNGTYTIGDIIDIDVTFSENVTSTGSVTVTLETGDTDRTCTFTISNSSSGSCDYTVQSGDTSSDLNVKTISGSISDSSSNALSNFTPSVNLSTNKDLVINTSSNSSSNSSSVSSNRTKSTSLARKIVSLINSGNVKLAQDLKEQYTSVKNLDNNISQNRTNYLFRRSLSKGSAGDEVRKLQEILSKDKNIYPEGLITGYFGILTEKAVRKYQIQYNIALENDPGYGFVGPKTRAILNQSK
jgi:hypothetical protein